MVTGASSGLGRAMAYQLAQKGAHPIIVARRGELLQELATEITALGVGVTIIQADLASSQEQERVFRESLAAGPVDGIILNAGITWFGEFRKQSAASIRQIIDLNVGSTVGLSHLFLPYFNQKRPDSALMIISSMGSSHALPYQALYAASKSLLRSFGNAIRLELEGQAPSVTVFCPGGMSTEMITNSGLGVRYHQDHPLMMSPNTCSRIALRAMEHRRGDDIPWWRNQIGALIFHFLPRDLVSRILAADYRKALPK